VPEASYSPAIERDRRSLNILLCWSLLGAGEARTLSSRIARFPRRGFCRTLRGFFQSDQPPLRKRNKLVRFSQEAEAKKRGNLCIRRYGFSNYVCLMSSKTFCFIVSKCKLRLLSLKIQPTLGLQGEELT
jgi:hypothetical protein